VQNKIDIELHESLSLLLNGYWIEYDDLNNRLNLVLDKKERQEIIIEITMTMSKIEQILDQYPENCYSIYTEKAQ
jgi:hypothetical protein